MAGRLLTLRLLRPAGVDQLLLGLLQTGLQLTLFEQQLIDFGAGFSLHLAALLDFLGSLFGIGFDLVADGFQILLRLLLRGCDFFEIQGHDWGPC